MYAGYDQEDKVDISEIIHSFWNNRRLILKITAGFVCLGLLFAILSTSEYQSEASLMPEYSSEDISGGSVGSLLQQYGGLLGMGGGGTYAGSEDAIRVQLYPDIVNSLPIQLKLLNEKVHFAEYDTTVTAKTFFEDIYTPSLFSYLFKLPGKIKGLFESREEAKSALPEITPDQKVLDVTKEQMELVEMMRDRVSVTLNEETGIVILSIQMPDARASAELGERAYELLTQYLTEYRTEKLRVDLEYVEEQYKQAQQRFRNIQNERAEFRDSNINLTTAKAQTELEHLDAEYDLAFNIYNSLAQQLEQVKLKLQEQTPLFKILQPFNVPVEKSWPNTVLILFVAGILGFLCSLLWILFIKWWAAFNN